jgi:hypothetical protein
MTYKGQCSRLKRLMKRIPKPDGLRTERRHGEPWNDMPGGKFFPSFLFSHFATARGCPLTSVRDLRARRATRIADITNRVASEIGWQSLRRVFLRHET